MQVCEYMVRECMYIRCVSEANWGARNWGFLSCCTTMMLCVDVCCVRVYVWLGCVGEQWSIYMDKYVGYIYIYV